jgi:hypothetical protein
MPTVACSHCQKKLNAKDEYIGKKLKCPSCGKTFLALVSLQPPTSSTKLQTTTAQQSLIDQSPAMPGQAPPRPQPRKINRKDDTPRFAVNWGFVAVLGVIAALLIVALIAYLGPISNRNKWNAMYSKAESDTKDVLIYVIGRYRALNAPPPIPGEEDSGPMGSNMSGLGMTRIPDPQVHDLTFLFNDFQMSFPKTVKFKGMGSDGPFEGIYHTDTGECEFDMTFGGTVLNTGIQINAGNDIQKFTGRRLPDKVTAEMNGKAME